jgi:hypothetical protein
VRCASAYVGRSGTSPLSLLHLNSLDDVEIYSTLLRKSLAANGGIAAPRKQITDPRGVASLWR